MNGEYDDDDFVPDFPQDAVTDFVAAASRNDLVAVHGFLGTYMDHVNDKVSDLSALMVAARAGHREMVRLLLDHGADIAQTDNDGRTALMLAAGAGRADVVTYLLEHGADPLWETADGVTAEQLAEKGEFTRIVRLLRDGPPPAPGAALDGVEMPGRYELQEYGHAVDRGDLAAVGLFLDQHPALLDAPVAFGSVALLRAVAQQQADMVRFLLERGAQVDVVDPQDGSTPLTRASWEGRMDIIRLLLNAGADVDMKSRAGLTPLVMAVCGRHEDAVLALLEAGADPELTNRQGRTPMQLAHVRGFAQMQTLIAPYAEKAARRRAEAEADHRASVAGRAQLQLIKAKKSNRSPFNKGGPKP